MDCGHSLVLHTIVMNTHTAASAVIKHNKSEKMKLNNIYGSTKVAFFKQMDVAV